jgi:hypothetical protein
VSSAINVTFGPPPTFSLIGLPDRIDDMNQPYIKLPPCPACGRTIDLDLIDVTAFGGPRTYLAGPWECPSGCDPRYRRFVLAADRRDFDHFCREQGWNPRRVVYIPTARYHDGDSAIRGCRIHPGMIHVTERARVDRRLHQMIESRIHLEARWHPDISLPFNINLVERPVNRSEDIRCLPWSGEMIEAEPSRPVPRDLESESWPDAYRWIPG